MPGVISTAVGNCGGKVDNPSYELVCTGSTGHAESVIVFYDSSKLAFTDILRQFFQSHDPTQGNGQGNDRGTQYRSALFLDNEWEYKLAQAAAKEYSKQLGRPVTTEIRFPPPPFYYAEDYMQQYLAKPGSRPYCSAMPTGVQLSPYQTWAPKDAPAEYAPKLGEDYWEKHAPVKGCVLREPHEQIKWPKL
jgi:peptide-methionine (S)-S-oxide reductase